MLIIGRIGYFLGISPRTHPPAPGTYQGGGGDFGHFRFGTGNFPDLEKGVVPWLRGPRSAATDRPCGPLLARGWSCGLWELGRGVGGVVVVGGGGAKDDGRWGE
jgi:hypothetical protein